MEVTHIALGHSQEQFAFLTPLLEALRQANPAQTVYFPDIGCSREAEIICEEMIEYDKDQQPVPVGILTFKSEVANARLIYQVVVSSVDIKATEPGAEPVKGLRMTMRLNKSARQRYYNPVSSVQRSPASVVQQIRNHFAVGAAYRVLAPIKRAKVVDKEAV